MKWYLWIIIAILSVAVLVVLIAIGIKAAFRVDDAIKSNMTEEQLLKLSDEDLIMAIITKIDYSYGPAMEAEKLAAMNDSEKVAYTVILFDWEVQNGGLCQYFVNPSRYTAPYLPDSLRRIGAHQMETIFSDFVLKHHIDISSLEVFRSDTIEGYAVKTELYPFHEFDDIFVETFDKENLESLNSEFIREHISDFIR